MTGSLDYLVNASGMRNAKGLYNDGLNSACANNGQVSNLVFPSFGFANFDACVDCMDVQSNCRSQRSGGPLCRHGRRFVFDRSGGVHRCYYSKHGDHWYPEGVVRQRDGRDQM